MSQLLICNAAAIGYFSYVVPDVFLKSCSRGNQGRFIGELKFPEPAREIISKNRIKVKFFLQQCSDGDLVMQTLKQLLTMLMLFRCKTQVNNIFFGPNDTVNGKFPISACSRSKIETGPCS